MKQKEKEILPPGVKKAVGPEVFVFLIIFLGFFVALRWPQPAFCAWRA